MLVPHAPSHAESMLLLCHFVAMEGRASARRYLLPSCSLSLALPPLGMLVFLPLTYQWFLEIVLARHLMMMMMCVVLLKRHSSIVRVPGRTCKQETLSLPPYCHFQGGARGEPHRPRSTPGNYLLTISMGQSPPDTVSQSMPPMPSVEG